MVQPKIQMIGKTFGRLTVLEQAEALKKERQAWYLCSCQCGKKITVRGTSLRNGQTASCGCLRAENTKKRNQMSAKENFNLTGRRFHFLTVQGELGIRRGGNRVWRCLCDCGRYHMVTTHHLTHGQVKSCGCIPSNKPVDLQGKKFGRLTVIGLTEDRKSNGSAVWKCRCDCGNEVNVSSGNLNMGRTVSCGCVRIENLAGQRFGKLSVVKLGRKSGNGDGAFWECKCDCGKECQVQASKLKSGHTQSCGCLHNNLIKDLTGERFGRLLVLGDSGKRRPGSGGIIWRCLCDCGQEKEIRQDALLSGATVSCGCLKSRGNEKVSRLLRAAQIDYIPEYSPPDMKGNRRFDFAVMNEGKAVYFIEYDGVLHTQYSNSGWDTADRFNRTLASDHEKNEYCRKNNIPLIRIPYTRFDDLCIDDLLLETTLYLLYT